MTSLVSWHVYCLQQGNVCKLNLSRTPSKALAEDVGGASHGQLLNVFPHGASKVVCLIYSFHAHLSADHISEYLRICSHIMVHSSTFWNLLLADIGILYQSCTSVPLHCSNLHFGGPAGQTPRVESASGCQAQMQKKSALILKKQSLDAQTTEGLCIFAIAADDIASSMGRSLIWS